MVPTIWRRDARYRYDPELQLREEAELMDPEKHGLVILPVEHRV